MKEKYSILILLSSYLFIISLNGYSEGTKQVRPSSTDEGRLYISGISATSFATYGCNQNYRLYIHIANPGETILFGLHSDGSKSYKLKDPSGTIVQTATCPKANTSPTPNDIGYIVDWNQAVNGPFPAGGGYTPLSYKVTDPTKLGDYYIEFSGSIDFTEWDFQVVTGANSPALITDTINGRVFSQAWQFYADLNTNKVFSGKLYVYSDDGIVTSCKYKDSRVGAFYMFCNSVGCTNTSNFPIDRQSKNTNTTSTFPGIAQYKIFLTNPDTTAYPNGVYGSMIGAPTYPYITFDPAYPECSGKKIIVVEVNKPGDIEVKITLPYGSPATDISLYKKVTQLGVSLDTLQWNGNDGLGVAVPDGTPLSITITYLNGLTNLPLWDIERNPDGFVVTLERPVNPSLQNPLVFWDDSALTPYGGGNGCPNPPTTMNTTGCTPGSVAGIPGCHAWDVGHTDCHDKMINTWWYSASTSNTTIMAAHSATPPLPGSTSPVEHCGPGTIDLTATVLPVEVVRWYDQQAPGGTVLSTGPAYSPSFPAPGIYHIYAEAYNPTSLCVSQGRTDITIDIIPIPDAPSGVQTVFRCGPGDISLVAVPGTDPANTIDWYADATGGVPLLSGSSTYTFTMLASTTTIYAETRDPNNTITCMSALRTPFTAEIRPVPIVNPVSETICSEDITAVSLTSTPPGATYSWNNVTSTPTGVITCCFINPGSGDQILDQLVNGSVNPATLTYNVIPLLNQCPGNQSPVNVIVNPLPVPSFTSGPNSVCKGSTMNVYTTEPGKSNYSWSVIGGNITNGGTSGSNTATVTWNTAGSQSLSVSYTEPTTLCTAASPTTFNVLVKPLPLPTINSSASSICQGIQGNVYTTESGMNNYIWSLTGGTITGGGDAMSNSATVTWNTVGLQTISVNYSDPVTLCIGESPTIFPVTVKPLPVPTINSLANSVCRGIPGNVYTTEAGKTNYNWTITGGTITAGGNASSNTASVTWNIPGIQMITVNYTEPATQCSASIPASFNVTVKDLPNPSFISGPTSVCQFVIGNVYVTEPGKNLYNWSVTGGNITNGGTAGSNNAMVTWNTLGIQNISVNYTDPVTGCTAAASSVYNVTVKAVPSPVIIGPTSACVNTPGSQYLTEAGMSNYIWAVNGGTFTPGPSPEIINVVWTSVGTHTISVDYTALDGCNATTPTVQNILVSVLPVPLLTGTNAICTGIPTVYSTDAGMQNYDWNISAGGTINSGTGTNSINVTWNTPGSRSVSVNYSLGTGCTALIPTPLAVTVNQSTPPTIQSSQNPVCESFNAIYTTQSGMSAYNWTVSPGGTIISGSGTNEITVTWNTTTNQSVQTNFTNTFGCIAPLPTTFAVTINPLPITTVNGNLTVCQDFPIQYAYQTSVIDPLATYNWQIISGNGTITPSATANPISINWNAPGAAKLKISAISGPGCPASRTIDIAVNPKPDVSMISCFDQITTRSAKRFLLKGGSPPYPLATNPPQGEYIFSPATAALQYDAVSGNYYFNPSLIPGNATQTFTVYYQYTNQFACPAKTTNNPVVQITVQGLNPPCGATTTDPRDGKSYGTTLVAGRCWMTENLNYKKGLAPNSVGTPMTDNCQVEKYCPPSDPTCTGAGGSFYQWDELIQYANTDAPNYQGLCPPGWHVPTETEWQTLIDNIDPSFSPPNTNGLAGASLKDTYKTFHALMTGVNYVNENWEFTTGTPTNTMYWTSTPDGADKAIARGLNDPFTPSVSRYSSSRENAFTVRCLKD